MRKIAMQAMSIFVIMIMLASAAWAGHETDSNTWSGSAAGNFMSSGSANSMFGSEAGRVLSTGYRNVILGFRAGYMLAGGSGNIFIGYEAAYNETGSNKLHIDNCYNNGANCDTPFIYG
jgi:trimeric autotransporter adhesin